jgi:EmrB/QacA subfamily drug resistance transporter
MAKQAIAENTSLDDTVNPARDDKLDPAVIKITMILLVGVLAPMFDTTIVNVALDTMAHELATTVSTIQWVVTGYLLTLSVVIPISGWAIARFGGKRLWIFSLLVFLAGSLLSAFSWNIGSLILFRLVQGIGGGMMLPVVQTLVVQATGGRALGRLMSIVSIPALLGPILGPILGGVIINDLSWRWAFLINVPICILALALAIFGLPDDAAKRRPQSLDVIGLLLLSPAFASLIYGISQVTSHDGFTDRAVMIPLISGFSLLVMYIFYALLTKRTPVIDLHLFRSVPFSASTILLFLSGLSIYGAMLILPLYYQQVRHESVLFTGVLMIPQGVGMLLTRSWFGSLTDRNGSRLLVFISLIIAGIGTVPFAFADANTSVGWLSAALVIRGAGLGGVTIPIMATAYQGLSHEQIPQASIAIRIFQQIGGAFGAAVLATVVQHQISTSVMGPNVLVHAFDVAFWWSIGFAAIALIPTFLLPAKKQPAMK